MERRGKFESVIPRTELLVKFCWEQLLTYKKSDLNCSRSWKREIAARVVRTVRFTIIVFYNIGFLL